MNLVCTAKKSQNGATKTILALTRWIKQKGIKNKQTAGELESGAMKRYYCLHTSCISITRSIALKLSSANKNCYFAQLNFKKPLKYGLKCFKLALGGFSDVST